MPLSYPLPTSEFIAALPIASVEFDCPEALEMSRTDGGEIITGSLGTRLWQGEVTLGRLTRDEARDAQTLINVARGSGASFFMHHTSQAFPKADPGGTLLGVATPSIASLPTDSRLISLKDLPAGYVLSRGDYLAFAYRSSPERYALHTVVDASVVASGSGSTAAFQVQPNLRPGAAVNAVVTLVRPVCKAVIIPGSVSPGRQNRFLTEGISFQFIQTLR